MSSKVLPPSSNRLGPPSSSRAGVLFDDSRLPISIYTFVGEVGPTEIDEMLKHSDEVLRRGRHAILMDLRRLKAMPALQRQQAAEWNAVNAVQLAKHRAGLAMVMTDGRERGIITAIYWHQPPANPYFICETMEEALAWCEQKLAE